MRLRFISFVFVAAFTVRLLLAFATGMVQDQQRHEQEKIAISLVQTGIDGNPYQTVTGPTAHSTPGYPVILAGLMKLFGTGYREEIAQSALTCLLAALRCALLTWFVSHAGLGRKATVVTGALSIFWLGGLESEVKGRWDAAATALLLLAMFILHYLKPLRAGSPQRAAAYGFGWGIAMLFNSAAMMAMAAIAIAEALSVTGIGLRNRRRLAANLTIAATCALVTMTPWMVRNYKDFGKPIFTRTNFGLEMWLSYHDGAAVSHVHNVPGLHPYYNAQESQLVAQLGEVEYNRQKLDLAIRWIGRHPLRTTELIILHAFQFWLPISRVPIFSTIEIGFTILFLFGLAALRMKHRPLFNYLAMLFIVFPAIYYIDQWSSRYRYPVEWGMLLSCSVAIVAAFDERLPARAKLQFRILPSSEIRSAGSTTMTSTGASSSTV